MTIEAPLVCPLGQLRKFHAVSYTVLLPLMAGRALRARERKREIADEMVAFFSSKIVKLYSLSEIPAVDKDLRTVEAYALYVQAELEIAGNPCAPLLAREKIERGVRLADEVLAKAVPEPGYSTFQNDCAGSR